jgi:hypothetical protein
MFFAHFFLASLTVATAVATKEFHSLNTNVFGKRQEYQPTTYTCGIAETCEEACGAGFLECGETLCYNPDLQHVCCAPECKWYTNRVVPVSPAHTSF